MTLRFGLVNGLGIAGAAVCVGVPFVSLAPNRLVSGHGAGLISAGVWGWGVLAGFAVLALLPDARSPKARSLEARMARGMLSVGLIWLLLGAAGAAARGLLAQAPPAARVALGAGFFLLISIAALALLEALRQARVAPVWRLAVGAGVVAGVAVMASLGALDHLSLAREYAVHRAAFGAALARHLLLVGLSLAGALAFGVPLGLAAWRRARLRPVAFAVLNVVQTVPSVALFGLLIAPLSAAGLSGIGVVPAVIALVLYALLPTVRGVVAGLDGVAAAPLEAAMGMGMAPGQVFWRVQVPLAAPALLAAARVVVVQAVGLAVVAALIGAGGLGDFVFQGLGQDAVDLVLLGALPATFLALTADAVMSVAADLVGRRAA